MSEDSRQWLNEELAYATDPQMLLRKSTKGRMKSASARKPKWANPGRRSGFGITGETPTSISAYNAAPPSIRDAFAQARAAIEKIPALFSLRGSLIGALGTVESLLIGHIDDDCYDTDPDCQFGSNQGLIHYYSHRIDVDHDLAISTFRLHAALVQEDKRNPHPGSFQYDDRSRINVWKMALAAARGDADRALESIAVLGHDVCCNWLAAKSEEFAFLPDVLSTISANYNSSDDSPVSNFFVPEGLPGTALSKSVMERVRSALAEYNRVNETDRSFRAGYYHVYGGLSTARALLSRGYGTSSGIRMAVLIPQALGHAYKRTQMPRYLGEDALEIWTRAEGDSARIAKSAPVEWEPRRKELALADLRLHLAVVDYTEEQHRIGAQFAFGIYRKKLSR